MKKINIFCFGFGQVAKNFIKKLSTENYKLNLSVTSRSESSKKTSNGIEYNNYLFDDKKFDRDLLIKLNQATHILISIPPINKEDIVLKNFYKESKKVSNEKIKDYFNYKLKFPSYVEGLSYIRDNFIKF